MKKFWLIACLGVLSSPVAAALSNGDFETGNLTGWQSFNSGTSGEAISAGMVAVVGSSTLNGPPELGSSVALLQAGAEGEYQRLWQDFTTAAGATLTATLKWEGHDSIFYDYAYNDDGYMSVAHLSASPDGPTWTSLWFGSIAKYGNYEGGLTGSSGWENITYNLSVAGTYRLEFGIRNVLDNQLSSVLFVDNVRLTDPVPDVAEVSSMSVGLLFMGGIVRRRRQAAARRL